MDFADFLAPFDAGTFRTRYFGRQPLNVRRAGSPLLPWSRFNEVLEWVLKQRMFSVEDALARQPGVDRDLLLA